MIQRRPHRCVVERAAADAACSPLPLRGWADAWIAPGGISAVHTECLKTSGSGSAGLG